MWLSCGTWKNSETRLWSESEFNIPLPRLTPVNTTNVATELCRVQNLGNAAFLQHSFISGTLFLKTFSFDQILWWLLPDFIFVYV